MPSGTFFDSGVTDLAYFQHRLSVIGAASTLPASVQFDMARSDMGTDELQSTAESFGAKPRSNGWGLSSLLDHVVSSRPDEVPISDLTTLQQNLKDQGYLAPSYPVNDQWDPEAGAAFRRWESDKAEQFYSGEHPGAISLQHAMSVIGWTLPSRVFQGLVGAAKGFAQQTPETIERVGALGGAAAGAGIGATIGSVVPGAGTLAGAAVGAVAGGAIGFLGDLFSHTDDEGNQSDTAKLLDALTPYEEYKQPGGAQKFFEDLGWTLTAMSLIKGGVGSAEGGFGVLGARAGAADIAATAEAEGTSFLDAALTKGANDEMGLSAKALFKPVEWFSKDAHSQLVQHWKDINFISQTTRPLLKDVVMPLYTGASAAQFGARAFSNLGAGSTDSTIRQAIDSAPLPHTGIDVPFLGDPVDWAAFVLVPGRWLPWKLGDLSKGAQAILGDSDAAFTPLVNWYRYRSPGTSYSDAMAGVKNLLGRDPAEQLSNLTMLHLEHGVESMAMKQMKGVERWQPDFYQRLESTKYNIRQKIIDEIGGNKPLLGAASQLEELRGGAVAESAPTLKEAMSYAFYDPMDPAKGPGNFSAYLDRLVQDGSGPERAGAYFDANDVAWDVTKRVRTGDLAPKTLAGKTLSPGVLPQDKAAIGALEDQKRMLEDQIERLGAHGATKVEPAVAAIRTPEQIRQLEAQLTDVYAKLDALKGSKRSASWADRMIIPMRADTPSQRTFTDLAKEYDALAKRVTRTYADENGAAHAIAKQELQDWLLQHEDVLPPRMAERARTASNPSAEITKHLKAAAKKAAQDVVLPEEEMQRFAELGYKPVLGHANNFVFSVDPAITEITGLGDYTRRQSFWDTLGLGLNTDSNRGIGAMRAQGMKWAVADVAKRRDIPLSADQIMTRLWTALRQHDAEGVVTNETVRGLRALKEDGWSYGPWIVPQRGKGGPKLFAYDIRNLKFDDVFESLRDVPGMTHEAAGDIYHALKSGAALGADMHFLHPLQSVRSVAPSLRINGWYGLSDLARTWHAEVPGKVPEEMGGLKSAMNYRPVKEFVESAERNRFTQELRSAAVKLGVSPEEEQVATMTMDALAHGAMAAHPDRYATVDDFFRGMNADFAEQYMGSGAMNELFRRSATAPFPRRTAAGDIHGASMSYLSDLLDRHADDPLWYEESGKAIRATFGGHAVRLGNGDAVPLDDLVTRVIAVTSGGQQPKPNFSIAMNAISKWLDDPSHIFSRADKIMGRDDPALLNRVFHDGWVPDTPKFGPFYQALRGNPDALVMDRRMAGLFGYLERDSKWRVTWTPEEQQVAGDGVRALAQGAGVDVRVAQERLWMGFKEFAADQAKAARKRGDGVAADLYDAMSKVTDSDNFAQVLDDPKYQGRVQELLGSLSEKSPVLFKQVEDEIQGSIQFGAEYGATMRFFRGADLGTLVHEQGHLLRRILPEEDVHALETAYGVRRAASPQGASQDLRDIAEEYTSGAGIEYDRAAHGEYAEVDEARAKRIADAYEKGPRASQSKATKRAYQAFIEETMAQYRLLREHGYEMVPWAEEGQPYHGAKEFIDDVRNNKRLFYFKTLQEDAFGKGKITAKMIRENPLLADSGVVIRDSQGNEYHQTYNDIFRAVHDIFGHAKEGMETGARGEENAWRQHARMYSPEARKAMTTETRGQNSFVNFGSHLRDEQGNIPKLGEPGYVRPQDRPFAEQKVQLLPDEFSQIEAAPPSWPREAEERFANDVEKYFTDRTAPAHGNTAALEGLRNGLGHLWSRFRGRVNDRNLVHPQVKKILDGWFGDVWKSLEPTTKPRGTFSPTARRLALQAGAGAALGAIEGDDKIHDALVGAAGGLALGLGTEKMIQRSYGYLPDHLLKLASALRYSLSPAFDVRRFVKQNLLAGEKYDLPFIGNSRRYITSKFGERGWNEALDTLGRVHGVDYLRDLDTFDKTLYAGGILGYSPVLRQAAHAYLLEQRGMSDEKIGLALRELYSYGTGRAPLEKTINFVFFPFSFEKKLLTATGDWILQNPGRNLLIYEGMRRYYQSKTSKDVSAFLTRHLPLLSNLNEFNAFAHGLAPGRFMLEGIVGGPDETHRTNAGKAAQIIANFFVPGGGAQTPVQEAIGGFGDLAVQAFSPIAVTGESIARLQSRPGLKNGSAIDQMGELLTGYIPMVKDLNEFWDHAGDQLKAFAHGESPSAQLTDYYDQRAQYKANLEPLAGALGYSSVDGFMQSDAGAPMAAGYQALQDNLRAKYPDAFQMTTRFEDVPSLTNAALRDVLQRTNPTPAEQAIQDIAATETTWQNMIEYTGMDSQVMGPLTAAAVRKIAMAHVNDPRFAELWDELFAYKYGPIRTVAA